MKSLIINNLYSVLFLFLICSSCTISDLETSSSNTIINDNDTNSYDNFKVIKLIEYKVGDDEFNTIQTFDLKKTLSLDFLCAFTKKIREKEKFYTPPKFYEKILKKGIYPKLDKSKSFFYFIENEKLIYQMNYSVDYVLVNVLLIEESSYTWVKSTNSEDFTETLKIVDENFSNMIDSLINIAYNDGVLEDEMFIHPAPPRKK